MDIMKSVNLVNKEVLSILDEFKALWWDDRDRMSDFFAPNCGPEKWEQDREQWLSDKYKDEIISMGSSHNGFPVTMKAYSLTAQHSLDYRASNIERAKKWTDLNEKLQSILGTRQNALCATYPPGGYISWHNNANASSYNLVITWSETGDGWWKHVDPYTNEVVTVHDKPGWQAKAFYFGSYEDDPKHLVYHAASTDCWRMTLGYMFDTRHKEYWEDVIEELEIE